MREIIKETCHSLRYGNYIQELIMALNTVNTTWLDAMAFENTVDGHKFTVDAQEEFGGKDRGPRPKPLLLASLAGCTGMDVVSILQKMKQNITFFNVKVEGELRDEHPKRYTKIKVVYQFKKSDNLDDSKVRKAIVLSEDRYCGVSAMLKEVCDLSWELEYLD